MASFAAGYFSTVGVPAWGFTGKGHALFSDFVVGARRLWNYVRAMPTRTEPRYLGHNPAAALMILFLLAMVTTIGVTGWMLTLDAFWGSEAVDDLHVLLVDITIVAVLVHVCAAIYESWNHRENLVWSMVTGRKRAPATDGGIPATPERTPAPDAATRTQAPARGQTGSSPAGT